MLGRGKAHYGHVPGYAAPDFVAVAKDSSVILVEAKYQRAITAEQIRQAQWYNAVATSESLSVRWVPQAGAKMRGTIQSSFSDPQECVLVNWSPGGGGVIPVTEKADATKETLVELWRIKRMGFQGRLPETDCSASCRCKRMMEKHGLDLKDGNIAIARPPVLSLGQAYLEGQVDLEGQGLLTLAGVVGGAHMVRDLRGMQRLGRFTGRPHEAEERMAALLGIPEDRARELLQRGVNLQSVPDRDARFNRTWKPLIGDAMTLRGIKAQTTRTYSAAKDAHRLLRKANQFWDRAEG